MLFYLNMHRNYNTSSALLRRTRFYLHWCGINVLRHGIDWDCDVIGDIENDCGKSKSNYTDLGVRFILGMSAAIHTLFCHFLNYFIFHVSKGIRMVAPELWGPGALGAVLWQRPHARLRLMQGLRSKHNLADPNNLHWGHRSEMAAIFHTTSPECTGNHC